MWEPLPSVSSPSYFPASKTAAMQLQQTESSGPGACIAPKKSNSEHGKKSTSLPFGIDVSLSSIAGSTYTTTLTQVQQVSYSLSDKIFTYSPDTFDFDAAVNNWKQQNCQNTFGFVPDVQNMETRPGAGTIALGYVFSQDFDMKKRHIPQSIIASSGSLLPLRATLDQLSLLHELANPFVAHVAAVDYEAGSQSGLVSDYVTALSLADELGLGLVSSVSPREAQHMALFATALGHVLPTLHIYDGITTGRETALVQKVLDQKSLRTAYDYILSQLSGTEVKHSDNEGKVIRMLNHFNKKVGTGYKLFEYHGHEAPEKVLVVFGANEALLASQIAEAMAKQGSKIGVINVRVYRPFVEEEFLKVLPKSVRSIGVLGQVVDDVQATDGDVHSLLYKDVLTALTLSAIADRKISVTDLKYSRGHVWTLQSFLTIFEEVLGSQFATEPEITGRRRENTIKKYSFWALDKSPTVSAPLFLANILSQSTSIQVAARTAHDNLVQGGISKTEILLSTKDVSPINSKTTAAFVGEARLLDEFDIGKSIEEGGSLVVTLPNLKDEDIEKKLPDSVRYDIKQKGIHLWLIDPLASAAISAEPSLESTLLQLAFFKVSGLDLSSDALGELASNGNSPSSVSGLVEELPQVLRQFKIPDSWAEFEGEKQFLPPDLTVNSFVPFDTEDGEPPSLLNDWTVAAKAITFHEIYGTQTALRPDVGVKTCVVHVKERRRLTPISYDRNVFHIEFDLGNSGLSYAIGEALGIHAENDPAEVEQFIKWYGLNPDEVVQVPSREDPNVLENRTVYQSLMQNVDIFGRPPKRFYEALSKFATDPKEKQKLMALSLSEGATEFKHRAEVDTITFADILLENPSAHPSFPDVVRIVSPMKRREYSIASSQHANPTSVSLLIVTVEWVDPQGRDRFGQATRYMNNLKVGAPVTVSVKPSVMKLPAKSTSPIIMAGLGTGLAPFRAFVQERDYQKRVLGQDIGAVMLYMGSRHQREEYLYGEEWEAYQNDGIITHMGKAFSRDQPQKIYIQDRMRQTMDELRQAYIRDEGSFYLCGPTWPVPDVTEVLQEVVEIEEKSRGAKKVDSRREIEKLKEDCRFVLEVY